ncbi:hypothetical protein E2986_11059 [Frieseomelitta varia]|uniref:Uncharacterized protein n=1 Tax=Frieseomelitta varia TaxID=561572 RepID=A0A833RFB3_9HYME|nr:hypothetical protein E2986_11059 [Frieseomelitta varia]
MISRNQALVHHLCQYRFVASPVSLTHNVQTLANVAPPIAEVLFAQNL